MPVATLRRHFPALLVLSAVLGFAGTASAATIYGAVSANTVLYGSGDRQLTQLNFNGAINPMGGADFLRFMNGYLYEPAHVGHPSPDLYTWNEAMPRDMGTSGHDNLFSPDRADVSSPFAGELTSTGTLAEIFGSFNGYNNMSWILDGETSAGNYFIDLYFSPSFLLRGDSSASTVELSILERGRNSDFNVYGIQQAGTGGLGVYTPTLTSALFVGRSSLSSTLWNLNTLEIDASQPVGGVGISLDKSWGSLVGVRIEGAGISFDGPDIVAVGATTTPEPATTAMLVLGLGALARLRRRRK